MAYVQKQGNNWQYTIRYINDGKTKMIKKRGFHSKEDALVEATKREAEIKKQYGENLIINGSRKPNIGLPKRVLNEVEYNKLYEELFRNLENELGYYVLLLNLTTGIRYSEAVALAFEDFNFTNNTINVNKSWERNGNISPIRSLSGNRIITLDKITMSRFKQLFKTLKTNTEDLVFCNHKSKYKVISKQVTEILLKKVLLNLNIEPVSANDLRYTHASILLSKGLPLQYITERLGHNNIDITNKILDHYSR